MRFLLAFLGLPFPLAREPQDPPTSTGLHAWPTHPGSVRGRGFPHDPLTEAQAVADGRLGQQDGPLGRRREFLPRPAEADPAGIEGIQDVGGNNVGVENLEGDGTKGDLENQGTRA